MTLGELFQMLAEHPYLLMIYFIGIPFFALLLGWIARGAEYDSPWKYIYSALIYLICVPGIFSVTLDIYFFIWERRPLLESNIYTQILPIVSMLITLFVIGRQVDFNRIPGFGKLSTLIIMIASVLVLMWIIDKTHIYVISYAPIWLVLVIFIVLLLVIRYGLKVFIKPRPVQQS